MTHLGGDSGSIGLTLAEGLMLVSPWKPVVYLIIFAGWAWIISTVYDKHAAKYFLPREKWNTLHLFAGLAAVLAAFLMPVKGEAGFFAGLGAMILILVGDLAAYSISTGKDDRVPADGKMNLKTVKQMLIKSDGKKKKDDAKQASVKLVIKGADEKGKPTVLIPAPMAETPEMAVRAAAEDLFLKAMVSRASQIDVAPSGKDGSYTASMLVDGVRVAADTMPAANALKVIDFWKSAARLDVNDRRKKLVGEVLIEQTVGKKKIRVTSAGVSGGMRLLMLFDYDTAVMRKPEELGLLKEQMEELRTIVDETMVKSSANDEEKPTRGVVLLGGQPDGGRTTTMISVLLMHDAYTQSVQTLEMEVQGQIEGVRHAQFDPNVEGADFATNIRSLLRRDPDVVGVGEMPDASTAQTVAKNDHERTRIYLCLRADGAIEAIDSFVKAVGDPALAAKGLEGVMVGKMVRKLCTNCRVSYPPAPDMLKKMGLGEAKIDKLYKKGGQVMVKDKPQVCPTCGGGGYLGQEGVFEVYRLDAECRSAIATGEMASVKALLKKRGLPTLQQAAIKKAVSGITSVEEMQRVFAAAKPAAAAPKA